MPDAWALGYALEDVERLQQVMDADARGQLSFVHKTAGTLFPLAVLLASWATASLAMRRRRDQTVGWFRSSPPQFRG